jgi:hypothetical protein
MPQEPEVLRLLQAYQTIWFSHFPMLSRRAEWHIAHHLCMRGRNGSPVGELYGLAKQIFLLDDATVKERLLSINQLGLCELDPPGQIYARTIATPTRSLLEKFDAHLQAFALALSETARSFRMTTAVPRPDELSPQYRAMLLQPLGVYAEQWGLAVDRVFESGRLSPARRMDAKRHLISSSHWNLLHSAVRWHYEATGSTAAKGGILADRLAAQLLQLTGQTLQTTRDHIAYLLEVGLFQRMPGKALHVAVSNTAIKEIDQALCRTAECLPPILEALFGRGTPAVANRGVPIGEDVTGLTVTMRRVPAEDVVPETPHVLEVIAPPGNERRIQVHPPLTIGRTAPSDLVLNGADISRIHCRIVTDGSGVAVSDLKSTNGTFVNDRRIAATAPLKPGDRLQIGSYVLVYQQQDPNPPPEGVEGTTHTRYRGLQAGR